jgi:ParB family chromosome partitioning protein
MSDKQRGLGRGLSALLGDPSPAPVPAAEVEKPAAATGAVEKPIELLVRNPDQPRRIFTEADIEDLANSIREKGVLLPLLVRSAPNAPGQFQIIAGERRWRAAQKAGLHTLPVIVREMDDLEVLEVGIIENVQRADLNPIEEARGYKALIDRFGRTQEALAQVVGKSRPHIANMLRLLSLPETVQDHVLHGRLSAGHARALVTAGDPEGLAAEIIANGLSVRQTEALVRKDSLDQGKVAPVRKAASADTLSFEQDLQESLGLKVKLVDAGGQGELRLSYKTLEQLEDLRRRLTKG